MDKSKIFNKIRNEYIDFFKKNPNPTDIQKRELYERLLKKTKKNGLKDFELFFHGSLSLVKKNIEQAKQYFKKANQESRHNPFPYNSLGLLEFNKKRIKNAIENYNQALKRDNRIYFIWYNLGRAYEKIILLEKAKSCYEHTLIFEKNNQDAITGLQNIDDLKKKFEKYKLEKFETIDSFYIFADIRGFTEWSNGIGIELEIEKLFNVFYPLASWYFGEKKSDSKEHKRIVKYLGDGFFAVDEITDVEKISNKLNGIISNINLFIQSVDTKLKIMKLPNRDMLSFGFGITYSRAQRFKFRGIYDWTGSKINLASRLCSEAKGNEILIEENLKTELEENNIKYEPKDIKVKSYLEIKALSVIAY